MVGSRSSRLTLLMLLLTASGPSGVGQAAPTGSSLKKRLPPAPSSPAFELDPLRLIKSPAGVGSDTSNAGPNVVIALDTSLRMAYDSQGTYYDLRVWDKDVDPAAASGLGVTPAARYYRRKFGGLHRSLVGGSHFKATTIEAIDETEADFDTFFDVSRLGISRDGLGQAVAENQTVVRFGLVRSRYGNGAILPVRGNQSPVNVAPAILPGDAGASGNWNVSVALTSTTNVDATANGAEILVRADSGGASAVLSQLRLPPDEDGGLLPAGADADSLTDAPVTRLLEDTRSEIVRLINADISILRPCRNTVVVLVVGGREGGTLDPVMTAGGFANIVAGGTSKPVPIFVVAVGPQAADEAQLQQIAAVSRGQYFAATSADEIASAVNHAVQSAYRLVGDFDAHRPSEFQTVGPVVGTVNLTGAKDITGALLPDTAIVNGSGTAIPQRGNVVVTGGFTLPGFRASLRAFRAYRPQADASRPTGYRFGGDGTRLWVASTPQAERRNVFTYIPGTGMVPFDATLAPLLRTYLRVTTDDAAALINFVRAEPLGAVIDSTPAIMDPPSIEPAPDLDYGTGGTAGTFAGDRRDRRAIVFYGGNDGMIHGIDARLGVEVWAFIPFNLLPKLRSLRDGQPVGAFEYFADSSPKIADVKVNGSWRTHMIVGQGAGGTFYQTFDVSDAGLTVASDSDNLSAVLGAFSSPAVIPLKWTFPKYEAFDYTLSNAVTPYGDLGEGATAVEKTVGQTWSNPAVGQLFDEAGRYVMIVGSGYMSRAQETQGARGGVRAGTTVYVVEMASGAVLEHRDVGDDVARGLLKNALHADPTLAGHPGTRFVNHAYIGDTEGTLWRFNLVKGQNGTIGLDPALKIYDASEANPIFNPPALADVGTSNRYIFLSTGTNILPSAKKLQNFRLIGLLDTGSGVGLKRFEIALGTTDGRPGDERPASAPAVAGDAVFFATTTDFPEDPCAAPESHLRALTYVGGPAYDTTSDEKVDARDSLTITRMTGRATTVATVDRHVFVVAGSKLESFGDPQDFNNGGGRPEVRMLSWREVR
ncbi:MAG: hypothetical protein EHM89_03340 [Acidobacteria bacterium]|nr:MAG: hypothetical protein EHM89_03340 [Acidobacteriota bacterium]